MIDNDGIGLRVAGIERTGWGVLGEFTVPAAAHEVKGVRRRLSALLPSAYAAIHDDVLLLTVELVGNALRHSGSPTIGILLAARDDAVHVAVTDAGASGAIPRVVDLGPDAESGRGLRMVDALTNGRWGTFLTDAGRVVWFEKALADA